ncbi:MAG: MFS transporter [Planctomycetes bacterium]|nr:MFS transporter [Planctomycetota bacterium]
MNEVRSRSILGLVFLTVFLDIVGFSIIFPLFPEMLDYYFSAEGAESFIGRVVDRLQEFAGEDRNAVQTLFGGLLGSVYGLLQFVFATFWGGLSDRIGRRPVLLITLSGTVLAYILWSLSASFWVLIFARVLGGAMAGNISTASAAVADTTSNENRAKGMGIVGMAIGLGFILGPALGAIFFALTKPNAGAEKLARLGETSAFGAHPFTGAAIASCVLALANLLWVAKRFPETLPPERRGQSQSNRSLNPFARLRTLAFPGVIRTNLVYFLYLTAFAAIEFTLTFLAAARLNYGHTELAQMFVFVGFVIAFVQGGLVRRFAPRYGEARLARFGLALTLPGFVLIGLANNGSMLYSGLACMAVGSAFVMPCLSALVSRYCPPDRQGLALGTFRSMGSLSRAIGPVIGALLYWRFGSASPYWIGAGFLLIPLSLALALPPTPTRGSAGNKTEAMQ